MPINSTTWWHGQIPWKTQTAKTQEEIDPLNSPITKK